MRKFLTGVVVIFSLTLGACGSGYSSSSGYSPSSGYSITAQSYNSTCSLSNQNVSQTVALSLTVTPNAYFQISSSTPVSSQISMTESGNCTLAQASGTPSCTYTFTYPSNTAAQAINFQINGSPGAYTVYNGTVGGTCSSPY